MCLLLFIGSTPLQAQKVQKDTILYRHSIGIGLGLFNHISYKAFVFEETAVDISVGRFIFNNRNEIYVSLSLKHHIPTKTKRTYTYFGGGFITEYGAKFNKLGVKFPLGFEAIGQYKRFSIYGEVSPMLMYESDFSPFSSFIRQEINPLIMINLGVRFIFIK